MAKPNKTVANARKPKKYWVATEVRMESRKEAEELVEIYRASKQYDMVKMIPFRTGPKTQRFYSYMVKGYIKNK